MHLKWNRRARLIVGYGVILAMTVAIGVTGLRASRDLAGQLADATNVRAPALSDAALVERLAGVVQTRLEGIVSAASRHEAQTIADQIKYLATRQDLMMDALDHLQQQPHSAAVNASIDRVRRATVDWWRQADTVEKAAAAQKESAAAEAFALTSALSDQAVQAAGEMTGLMKSELHDLAVRGAQSYAVQRIWMLALLAAAIVVAVFRLLTAERTNRRLEQISADCVDGGNELASAAAQVSTSAQSLAQTAGEQAASLEETAATMEELAQMTRQNAEHSQRVATLMRDADQKVDESNHVMSAAALSMTGIEESSHKVARILKTIDEITFQTNILALNAAVEAARAGEAGLGFAAVAEEVRNLAQRSASAARETAVLVEESLSKARDGRQRIEQLSATLDGVTVQVRQVRELADEVSTASRQQAQGIGQVSEAVAQLEQVTQSIATTSEENAAASEEVSSQSAVSLKVASELRALVDGSTAARVADD